MASVDKRWTTAGSHGPAWTDGDVDTGTLGRGGALTGCNTRFLQQ
jgi:hypothetical protein